MIGSNEFNNAEDLFQRLISEAKLLKEARESKKKEEDEGEEVRCVCPKCYGEGWCYVSVQRAKELEELDEMEEACPYGDRCEGGYESEKEEEEEPAGDLANESNNKNIQNIVYDFNIKDLNK